MSFNLLNLNQYTSQIRLGLLNAVIALAGRAEESKGSASQVAFSTIEINEWKTVLGYWNEFGRELLTGLPPRACPTCNSKSSHVVFESYDGYIFSECEECGTWYVPLSVDWKLFERFFERCPEARRISEQSAIERLKEPEKADFLRFRGYLKLLLELLPISSHQKRYLDIGCCVGNSMTVANEFGMLAHGVEADCDAAAIARRKHSVVVDSISSLSGTSYDLITLWETLEHLENPSAMLGGAAKLLAPSGLIALTIPNLDASGLRVAREKCSYVYGGYMSPGHINLFNRNAIEILLKRAGLALIEVSYEFSTDPYELFGYLRGIKSIDRPFAMACPPLSVIEILNAVWPAVTLIEDLAGTLPIMHCIACRVEDVSLFSEKCSERSSVRRHSLINAAKEQLNQITDPFKVIQDLQEEINKRDSMLESMQSNINRDRWWKRWRI